MRRFYSCVLIVAVVLCLTGYSGKVVREFTYELEGTLNVCQDLIRQENYGLCRNLLQEEAERCVKTRKQMSLFFSVDPFLDLQECLSSAQGYAEMEAKEEVMGELQRAEIQAERIRLLAERGL